MTCAAGDLAAGESKTFSVTGQIASSLDTCLRNTATTVGATLDPNTSNNSSMIEWLVGRGYLPAESIALCLAGPDASPTHENKEKPELQAA